MHRKTSKRESSSDQAGQGNGPPWPTSCSLNVVSNDVWKNQILGLLNTKFGGDFRIKYNKEYEVLQVPSWEDLKGSRLTFVLHVGRTRQTPRSRHDEELHLPVGASAQATGGAINLH
ncbi:hypothetical protein NPIL_500761 [Nephila pilipes]|uniref:Uncharacterized protein n=1 Tax=Nephila pilipes TaxID=299642 RepID=A0A8X6MB69_NEPPI|nr:hypothetical protein NPIL_500761 [Nephila pilipes]